MKCVYGHLDRYYAFLFFGFIRKTNGNISSQNPASNFKVMLEAKGCAFPTLNPNC